MPPAAIHVTYAHYSPACSHTHTPPLSQVCQAIAAVSTLAYIFDADKLHRPVGLWYSICSPVGEFRLFDMF